MTGKTRVTVRINHTLYWLLFDYTLEDSRDQYVSEDMKKQPNSDKVWIKYLNKKC